MIDIRYVLSLIFVVSCSAISNALEVKDTQFSEEQITFFEEKVRPLLSEHCYQCHSTKAKKLKGGLLLDSRAAALKGGDSGAAFVPGKPADSLLIKAVRWESFEMPPQGKLKANEIAILTKWIEMDAPWPPSDQPGPAQEKIAYDWDKWRREHWAFQPIMKPSPPDIANAERIQNDIDRFVFAKLNEAGLKPASPAEPHLLLRRMYFDLIGLPPTPDNLRQFLEAYQKNKMQAITHVIDTLLASPHYGERWGRHWLDVARYSDGYGGFLDNAKNTDAWRFRDWVVDAFNRDMPFDEFIRMQIAGDLLGDKSDAVATGFFALGPLYSSDGGTPESIAQAKAETYSDRLDTLGRGMLGLTLACARCHDHKFDPIPQQDYYSLAGVFSNTQTHLLPLAKQSEVDAFNQHQKAIGDLNKKLNDLRNLIKKEKRKSSESEEKQLRSWDVKLTELRKNAPTKFATAHTLRDSGSTDMHVAIRGDLRKQGELAPRRFLKILERKEEVKFDQGSGRMQLAQAITDRSNPLTTRVFVNRVWMHHFGRGIVRTPSNFGANGEKPTHPELLDWLTMSFIESKQSIKALHRTIMLSATYQMSSNYDEAAFQKDGDNRLIWRMNHNRLDVEAWRDALLYVTGEIDLARGGPPIDRIESPRRSLYFKVSRNGDAFATDEFLRRFDFPIMRATIDKRPTSVVPQQYLFLMNSPFMHERAKALVKRLTAEAKTDAERINLVYLLLYQRAPSDREVIVGLAFVAEMPKEKTGLSAWEQYAQVLLATNEFMYVK